MSNPFKHIGHDIKHAADHAGHAIAQGGKDAGKGIADQGKDISHGDFNKAGHDAKHDASSASTHARHSADAIGKDVEDAIVTTLNDVQDLWNKAKHDLEAAEHKALGSLEAKRKEAWNSLNSMKHSVAHDSEVLGEHIKSDIQKAGDESKKTLETWADDEKIAWQQVGHDIKEDLEAAASSKIASITAEAIEKGIKEAHVVAVAMEKAIAKLEDKAPTIVDMLNNQSLPINLGPIVLTYQNGVQRIEELADALGKVSGQDFKLTQTFINDLLDGLGPDSISIHADVEFFVEVGLDLDDIPFRAFVEIADIVFDALGVPK